jgi:hypothetical protein
MPIVGWDHRPVQMLIQNSLLKLQRVIFILSRALLLRTPDSSDEG